MDAVQRKYKEASRRRQLHDADNSGDWILSQLMYEMLKAPYSQRLFGYDIAGNAVLNKAILGFLTMEEPGDPSLADAFIPSQLRKAVQRKIGSKPKSYVDIPDGIDEKQAIEELSYIWFSAMTGKPGFDGIPREVFTKPDVARRFQARARDFGVFPMLEAWEAGVPVSDIIA